MKVVCVTTWSPYYQPLADITLPNLWDYAFKHDYLVYEHKIEDGKFHFEKHKVFKELFNGGAGIIFYKDIDSMITNLTIPIESFIDLENDFYITKDKTELNGGVMILKNTSWCMVFNDAVLSYKNLVNNEQNAINLMYKNPQANDFIKVLPQSTINSYLYEMYPEIGKQAHEHGQWEEGDFLLHLPALTIEKRIEILKNIPVIK